MKLPISSGDYQSRSAIASAQRNLNLYLEKNAEGAPFPITAYMRAGLTPKITGYVGPGRCAYTASSGQFFEVVGPNVYYTDAMWQRTLLGTIPNGTTPVVMSDNGLAILIVDGSSNGWCIDMTQPPTSAAFAPVSGQAGAFYGGTRVDEVDTFFLLNVPGTNEWYVSLSEVNFANLTGTISPDMTAAAFDPLDIAAKTGNPDPLAGVIVMHREPWLVGTETTEVWYDAGSADFAFGELPGVFIEHGCVAPYSLAKQDLSVYWLSSDRQGQTIVLSGNQYAAKRISTHAIEQQLQQYPTVADAIGSTFQQLGHVFYKLDFPTADATWVYDVSQDLWAEWAWIDTNGLEHRHRAANAANAYGVNVCQDWQTGALYAFDLDNYTDAGMPIGWRRGFQITQNEGKRVAYSRFIADMDVGEIGTFNNLALGTSSNWTYPGAVSPYMLDSTGQEILDSSGNPIFLGYSLGSGSPAYPVPFEPQVSLRYSDDRGKNWSNPRTKGMGTTGQYNRSVLWTRLGMGRNRVWELFGSAACFTALNGGYVELEAAET